MGSSILPIFRPFLSYENNAQVFLKYVGFLLEQPHSLYIDLFPEIKQKDDESFLWDP